MDREPKAYGAIENRFYGTIFGTLSRMKQIVT